MQPLKKLRQDLVGRYNERHADKLPSPGARQAFIERIASPAVEAIAEAIPAFMRALRSHPDTMLAGAFEPTIIGMRKDTVAKFEFEYSNGSNDTGRKPSVTMRATTIIDGSFNHEICVRLIYRDGEVTPVKDDRAGV